MVIVLVGDITAQRYFLAAHVGVAGGHADQRDFVNDMAAVARLGPAVQLRDGADGLIAGQRVAEVFVFFQADGAIVPQGLQISVVTLRPFELVDYERVRAKVGDAGGDVEIHAVHHRHYHDQGGGGDHDAQQGQERPQFVRAQFRERQPKCLARRNPETATTLNRRSCLAAVSGLGSEKVTCLRRS